MSTASIRPYKPRQKGINSIQLKLIAMLSMLIDHIGAGLISFLPSVSDNTSLTYNIYWLTRIIGRFAFPIYLFLLIEGIRYTHSKTQYAIRLFLFGIISEIPFDMCGSHELFDWEYQNVMFTLLFAFLAICGYMHSDSFIKKISPYIIKIAYLVLPALYFAYRIQKYINNNTSIHLNKYVFFVIIWIFCEILIFYIMKSYSSRVGDKKALIICTDVIILAACMGLADLCHTDYSSTGVLAATMMYLFRTQKPTDITSGCIVLTALSNPLELATFAMVPVIGQYNGKKGTLKRLPLYFYYPAHMLLIALIAMLVKVY